MNNKKSTKRALISSVLSLVLCVSMLIGTTFAWFTDTATSKNNKIVAGNLDVQLLMHNGTDYKDISNTEGSILGNADSVIAQNDNTNTLWEPGKTQVAYLAIKNNGNLALRYQVMLEVRNPENGKDLYKAMQYVIAPDKQKDEVNAWDGTDAKTPVLGTQIVSNGEGQLQKGETHYFALSVHMMETAGNEYQGGQIDFDLSVFATQLTSENDSFNNQYDAFADYDGEISGDASLKAALTKGGTYKVIADVVANEVMQIPEGVTVNLDLNGNDISSAIAKDAGDLIVNNGILTIAGDSDSLITNTTTNGGALINNKGTLTLKGGNYVGAPIGTTGYPDYAVYSTGQLVIEDGTSITSDRGILNVSGETVINGGKFVVTSAANGQNLTLHTVYASGSTLTINGGTFENNYSGVSGASVICPAGATITVNDGTFRDATDDTSNYNNTANFQNYMGYGKPVVVYGGSYDDTTVKKNLAQGYTTIENADGTYSVVKGAAASNQTALDEAIAGNAPTVVLGSGEYIIPDSAMGKTMTIIGNGDTVVAVQDDGGSEGDIDYSFRGSNVTFENVTLNIKGNDHPGYAGLSATYNSCKIVGSNYTLYGDSVFNNCTFNLNNGYVWTWGAANVEFNNCTFEDIVGGKAKAILVHNTTETVVTVKDCKFIATSPAQTWDGIQVAAVSIDPENGSPDATVHFEGTNTYSDAFYALYQVKYADEVDDVTITVDGVEVEVTAMK